MAGFAGAATFGAVLYIDTVSFSSYTHYKRVFAMCYTSSDCSQSALRLLGAALAVSTFASTLYDRRSVSVRDGVRYSQIIPRALLISSVSAPPWYHKYIHAVAATSLTWLDG